MSYDMIAIKAAREHYRPQQIKTLFVGESPPFNGNFFRIMHLT